MAKSKVTGATLALLFVLGTASVAAPVDHNAPSGIASVAPLFGKLSYTILRGERLGFPMLAVGIDGAVFCIDYEGNFKPFRFSDGSEAEWPVEFARMVDWEPAAVEVPWYDTPIVTLGAILTSDGERWVQCVRKLSGDWDEPGEVKMKFEWKKLSVKAE